MSRPVRVLFVIGSMGGGGAERQVLEYLRRLDRSRFQPLLYLAHRQGELLPDVPPDVSIDSFWEQFPRWLARLCWVTGTTRLFRWGHLVRLLRSRQIDVVYDRTFLATLDSGPATWWRPTPRLSAVVADPKVQMDLYFPRRQWLWRRFARAVYASATMVLTNSHGLRQQVIDYFRLPPEHVLVLTNVIDLERLDKLASAFPVQKPADQFRILTVGRIDQHKGHLDLLEAVRQLVQNEGESRLLWQIIGDGPARQQLLDNLHALNLKQHVEWLGSLRNPYPYYRAADVYCSPSWTEGSPNVLLEALCLATPVLSTDCPCGPREILEEGRWGTLVPTRNPSALAEALRDRITRPEWWMNRALQAQPVIRERYDSRKGVQRLEQLLESLMLSPGGPPPLDTPHALGR